jgi:uncharacterized membrane protein YgdD (TMEM256/DUF423 family)
MSLWFRRRDKDGRVHQFSVPFEPLALIAVAGISLALILPFLQSFRSAVAESPTYTLTAIVVTLAVGFAMFATAKLSVVRSGPVFSFGTRFMSGKMKVLYLSGYVLLAVGTSLGLLFAFIAHSLR